MTSDAPTPDSGGRGETAAMASSPQSPSRSPDLLKIVCPDCKNRQPLIDSGSLPPRRWTCPLCHNKGLVDVAWMVSSIDKLRHIYLFVTNPARSLCGRCDPDDILVDPEDPEVDYAAVPHIDCVDRLNAAQPRAARG